jgi:hypothetical protein
MKRIELFEFEDHPRFPSWLRDLMTTYLVAFHRIFQTAPAVADLVRQALAVAPTKRVLDLCSGGGGPMPDVVRELRRDAEHRDVEVILSDLYPNASAARQVEALGDPKLRYEPTSVDATRVGTERAGVRTLIGSFHHLSPDAARAVLLDAAKARQPLVVFEVSDNGPPIWLWWTAIPASFLLTLFLTPFVRPLSFQMLFFTYFVPLLPLFIAWDGAASNARTYTPDDVRELLRGHEDPGYTWEVGARRVGRLPGKSMYVIGKPVDGAATTV